MKVLCPKCDKQVEDLGKRNTCPRCGCSPVPSYSYKKGTSFHPSDVDCEVGNRSIKPFIRKRKTKVGSLIKTLLFMLVPSFCFGQAYIPPDVQPGQPYHLIFATEGVTEATEQSIDYYNNFVNAEAVKQESRWTYLGGGLTYPRTPPMTADWGLEWFAVASTEHTDARDNALQQGPVYKLDGTRIDPFGAGGATRGLWQGWVRDFIDVNQYGWEQLDPDIVVGVTPPPLTGDTWTGTTNWGTASQAAYLGYRDLYGFDVAQTGVTFSYSRGNNPIEGEWIENKLIRHLGNSFPPGVQATSGPFSSMSLYAISELLIDGYPVPFLQGDYTADGIVDQADLDLVLVNWNDPNHAPGDHWRWPPNGWIYDPPTGPIDQAELDQVLLNWGNTRSPIIAASVPEMDTLSAVLLILAAGFAGWYSARPPRRDVI